MLRILNYLAPHSPRAGRRVYHRPILLAGAFLILWLGRPGVVDFREVQPMVARSASVPHADLLHVCLAWDQAYARLQEQEDTSALDPTAVQEAETICGELERTGL